MELYRINLSMRGASGTPLLADTIYGHLCWAALRLGGQEGLDRFLGPARKGEPLLVLSDGFPSGLMPMPVLAPEPIDASQPLAIQRTRFRQERLRRKDSWTRTEEFSRALSGERPAPAGGDTVGPVARVALKNQIDRLTATTPQEGGGLYEFDEVFNGQVSIYARISQGAEDIVQSLFNYLADSGYGKRKAAGYGQIESTPSLEPFEGFGSPEDANAFVSLSTFVPAQGDPRQGYWNLLVKYGKVGEELAYSDNPFKFPLLMLRAGAVFYDSPVREFYGRVVEGVSPVHDFVCQPAFSLAIPMRLAQQ